MVGNCGFLSGSRGIAMEDAGWTLPPFRSTSAVRVSRGGDVRPTLALVRQPEVGRDRLGQQVRARLRGLAVLPARAAGRPRVRRGASTGVNMSKFAGATWSGDHRHPTE